MSADPLPSGRATLAISLIILIAYVGVSGWTLMKEDADLKVALLQNWHSLAGLAVGFWLGSSVGGRQKVFRENTSAEALKTAVDKIPPVTTEGEG